MLFLINVQSDPRQISNNPSLFNSHLRSPTVCSCLSLCDYLLVVQCVSVSEDGAFSATWACVLALLIVFSISFMPFLCRAKALFHGFPPWPFPIALELYFHTTVDWETFMSGNFRILKFCTFYFRHLASEQNFFWCIIRT